MGRKKTTTIPNEMFEDGEDARLMQPAFTINHNDDPSPADVVLNELVDALPEPERSAVQMCVMRRISYREALALFQADPKPGTAPPQDARTVQRWAERGVQLLGEWIGRSGALTGLLNPEEG